MTYKTYTDLEQSKRLAGILSIESADGYWCRSFSSQTYKVYTKGTPNLNSGEHTPCWSLSSLLNYLWSQGDVIIHTINNQWELDCVTHVEYAENLIDACVNMIFSIAKSDDERIKDSIIAALEEECGHVASINGITIEEMVEWLENIKNTD